MLLVIQMNRNMKCEAKKKLDKIGKEKRDLDERIKMTELKLEENDKNLDVLKMDLVALRAFPASSSSSIAVRIRTLKSELYT